MDDLFPQDLDRENKYHSLVEGKTFDEAKGELIGVMKLDFLIATATLIGDFELSINKLISLREDTDVSTKDKLESVRLLTGLLLGQKDKKIEVPQLDIDEMVNQLSKLTEDNI